MSHTPCEDVAERVALGEPLGELAGHAASCDACRKLANIAGRLATAHAGHAAVDPGLGFAARMTVGAQQRLAIRKRRRLAASLAAVTMASVTGVFVVTRHPKDTVVDSAAQAGQVLPQQVDDTPTPLADGELNALLDLADTHKRVAAPWRRIEQPLKPYKELVRDTQPAPPSDDSPTDDPSSLTSPTGDTP